MILCMTYVSGIQFISNYICNHYYAQDPNLYWYYLWFLKRMIYNCYLIFCFLNVYVWILSGSWLLHDSWLSVWWVCIWRFGALGLGQYALASKQGHIGFHASVRKVGVPGTHCATRGVWCATKFCEMGGKELCDMLAWCKVYKHVSEGYDAYDEQVHNVPRPCGIL